PEYGSVSGSLSATPVIKQRSEYSSDQDASELQQSLEPEMQKSRERPAGRKYAAQAAPDSARPDSFTAPNVRYALSLACQVDRD
ncbi:hypothetical protein FGG80_26780, partial [Escherichia coli]